MVYEVKLMDSAVRFILSTPVKMQAKIQRTISLLREFGFQLTMPHSRMVNRDLKELRIKVGTDITRLFYFAWRDRIYVVTSGYVKKTDKADPDEITRALSLMTRFKEKQP